MTAVPRPSKSLPSAGPVAEAVEGEDHTLLEAEVAQAVEEVNVVDTALMVAMVGMVAVEVVVRVIIVEGWGIWRGIATKAVAAVVEAAVVEGGNTAALLVVEAAVRVTIVERKDILRGIALTVSIRNEKISGPPFLYSPVLHCGCLLRD